MTTVAPRASGRSAASLSTAAAFALYISSVAYIEPSEASLLNSLEPLSSIAFSVLFLGMTFGGAELLGAACIIAAVLAVTRA